MKNTTRSIILGLALLAVTQLLFACASWKADRAPFYIYNQSVLNEEISPAYQPRRPDPYRNTYLSTQSSNYSPDTRVAMAPAKHATDAPRPKHKAKRPKNKRPKAKRPKAKKNKQQTASKSKAKRPPARGKSRFNPEHSANYLKTIYEANGIKLGKLKGSDAVATLYAQTKKKGQVYHATRPAIGDLVFFHNTYDRNGDGRNNDWYTHVGLVEDVEKDGTIHVLSYLDNKVQSFSINLEHPRLANDDRSKKIWNTPLRAKGEDDPAFTQYLGGELFAGFGGLLGTRTELVVVDEWTP